MVKRANRVQETAITTGTGTLTLAGAVSKYRAFSASFAVGDSIYYSIEDVATTDWEVGAGTLLSATTLSRDQVFSSSNAGALVAFTAGTRNVWCTDPAENQWPVVKNSTTVVEVCTVPVGSQMIVVNTFDNRGTLEVLEHLEILDAEVVSGNSAKLQSISASVAANALTLTYNGGTLDFRSASLTEGATAPLTVSANSIVVPSGATLGMLSAIQGRLILLEAYNGGSPVACVANLSGGLQLDETNLISPTTISAAATSASVIYSASAVSANSPYRVVGFVDIIETTAGTWASDATLKQGIGGQALAAMSSLGYGQTWQNVTASRAIGTTYYNTTGKPILIAVDASTTTLTTTLQVSGVDTITFRTIGPTGTVIVPNGNAYILVNSNGIAINRWSELR